MRYREGTKNARAGFGWSFNDQLRVWITKVVRHPRVNIVLPLLILTVFSYHSLSDLSIKWPHSGYLSKLEPLDSRYNEMYGLKSYNLTAVPIMVRSIDEDQNMLEKKSLLEYLAFQNKLLEGLPKNVAVNSPFEIWNHSLDTLYADKSPLQTVNVRQTLIPPYSLLETWKINGFISSAKGCIISLFMENNDYSEVNSLLQKNIESLSFISNVTTFHIMTPQEEDQTSKAEKFRLFISRTGRKCDITLLLVYLSLALHLAMSMKVLRKLLRTVVGMSLVIVAQIALAMASSKTVTELLFKRSNDTIPTRLLCWPVIFFLMNSYLNAIQSLSQLGLKECFPEQGTIENKSSNTHLTAAESSEIGRAFIHRLSESQFKSFKFLLLLSTISMVAIPFNAKATNFILFSLWLGEALKCTLFTAILSLDWRRCDDSIFSERSGADSLLLDDDISARSRRSVFECSLRTATSIEFTSMIVGLYFVFCSLKFSLTPSSASLMSTMLSRTWSQYASLRNPRPRIAIDQRFIAEEAVSLIVTDTKQPLVIDISMRSPIPVIQSERFTALRNVLSDRFKSSFDSMSAHFFYKVDFTYALQFVALIVLVLSCTLLGLQKLAANGDNNNVDLFKEIRSEFESDLSAAKKTDGSSPKPDATKILTRTNPDNFHMKELYKDGHGLDITLITTSKAPFIVSSGLDHKVLVWSPLANPVPAPTQIPLERKFWPLNKVVLSNDGNHIAFFAKNGFITTWSRKHMKFIWEVKLKDIAGKNALKSDLLEAFFRKITVPAFRRKRLQNVTKQPEASSGKLSAVPSEYVPVVTGGLDASYENPRRMSNDTDDMNELVFVTSAGFIYSIRDDGVLAVERLTPSTQSLKSCKLLSSPRVNDRMVICDEIGDIYITTVVNNKWRPMKLKVNYDRILKPPTATCELTNDKTSRNPVQESALSLETDYTIELVQFVGLILRVLGRTADLIDAQTGTVVKRFSIDHFKPNTLRVFHDSPTHCKFCGSASVASFTIAYTDAASGRVTMHSYKLESRTKTSICLRVERDLREIRCLGMESAVETVHYLYDSEDWCVTDNNMLIGIRKVPQVLESSKAGSSSMARGSEHEEVGLQQRRKNKQDNSNMEIAPHLIHNIWEGWTMSACGKIISHKIPVGVTGLVTDRLGPLVQFGAKAVVVGFANIMDMFYVGNEDLIFSTETTGSNKEETSLRFVNNRRDRFSHKRMPLNYDNLR